MCEPLSNSKLNSENPLKIKKIFSLLHILDKASKKQLRDPPDLCSFKKDVKQLQNLHYICLMEVCHILHMLNLDFEAKVLLKLFKSFKSQLFYFLKYHQETQKFFDKKEIRQTDRERGDNFNEDFLLTVAKLLEKIDKKSDYYVSNDCERYEKLEKAKFFLEQEALELDTMLRNYEDSKDEIEHFLRRKINLKKIGPSGVNKILEGLLNNSKLMNIFEPDKDQKEKYSSFETDYHIEDLKPNLLERIDTEQKRCLNKMINSQYRYSAQNFPIHDQETQTEYLPSDDLENPLFPSSVIGLRKMVFILTTEKKELNSKLAFLNQRTDHLNGKIITLERKLNQEREEGEKLKERISEMNFKITKKKQKGKFYKTENKDLLEKLELYVDKDQMQKILLRNKGADLQKISSEAFLKEKQIFLELKTQNEEIQVLQSKNQNLQLEISKLNDLLEIERQKIKEEDFCETPTPKKFKPTIRKTIMGPIEIGKKHNKVSNFSRKEDKEKPKPLDTSFKVEYPIAKISLKPEEPIQNHLSAIIEQEPKLPIELKQWLDPLSEALLSTDKLSFEKNLSFLLQNKHLDLEKQAIDNKILTQSMQLTQNSNTITKEDLIQQEINKNEAYIVKSESSPRSFNFKIMHKQNKKPQTSDPIYRNSLKNLSKQPSIIQNQPSKASIIHPSSLTAEKEIAQIKTKEENLLTKTKKSHLKVKTQTDEVYIDVKQPNKTLWTNNKPRNINNNPFLESLTARTARENEYKAYNTPKNFGEGYKEGEEDPSNYSKKKFLYKYPFKDIEEYGYGEFGPSKEFFERVYSELSQKHESCGKDCRHLKRFFGKVRFMGKNRKKKELQVQKNVIDRLPFEFKDFKD